MLTMKTDFKVRRWIFGILTLSILPLGLFAQALTGLSNPSLGGTAVITTEDKTSYLILSVAPPPDPPAPAPGGAANLAPDEYRKTFTLKWIDNPDLPEGSTSNPPDNGTLTLSGADSTIQLIKSDGTLADQSSDCTWTYDKSKSAFINDKDKMPDGKGSSITKGGSVSWKAAYAPGTTSPAKVALSFTYSGFPFSAAKDLTLLPMEFKVQDGKVNDGFDPPLKGHAADAQHLVPLLQSDPPTDPVWTSVVSGATNSVVKLVLPSSSVASMFYLHSATNSIVTLQSPTEGSALSAQETNISLQGAAGITAGMDAKEGTIEVRVVGSDQVVKTLRVMVLPPVTVEVGIYYVIDGTSADTYDLAGSNKVLSNAPSRTTILSKLNDVYPKQTGITFQLNPPANDTTTGGTPSSPIDIKYDLPPIDGRLGDSEEGNRLAGDSRVSGKPGR